MTNGLLSKADIRSGTTIGLIIIFGAIFVGASILADHSELKFTQSMWSQLFSLFIGLIIGVFAWLGIRVGAQASKTDPPT